MKFHVAPIGDTELLKFFLSVVVRECNNPKNINEDYFIDFTVVRNLQTIRKSILFTYLFWGKMLTCDFFLFFLCDLTFFLGEKATSAAFSALAFGLGLENMPWLPFPPEKKSNHT